MAKETKVTIADSIMSGVTAKDLLLKWTDNAVAEMKKALVAYYGCEKTSVTEVQRVFAETSENVRVMSSFLKDLTAYPIENIYDTIIAVYGIVSPQVRIYKAFTGLFKSRANWNEAEMWNSCAGDEPLQKILFG